MPIGETTIDIHPVQFGGHGGYGHVPRHGPYRKTGVVICSPPGRDGRCGYRFLFELAQRLAAQGYMVLRFEPLGCGNSADLVEPEADVLPVWKAGLRQAVETLKGMAPLDSVVVCGLRFSATLAMLCPDIGDGLMLFGPVLKGKSWIRELKIARAVLAPTKTDRPTGQGLDADGLFLSDATLAHLGELALKPETVSAVPVFMATHNAEAETFAAGLNALTVEPFEGFAELFEDTSRNQIPHGLIAGAANWMTTTFAEEREAIDLKLPPGDGLIQGQGFDDAPVDFGPGLRGNWCAPSQKPASDIAVVICNTSGEPRAGIGGFSTGLARRLAQQGVASLRFDFTGLGDSDDLKDGVTHVYETSRDADFRAAIALAETHHIKRMVLIGVCSGGYHALDQGTKLGPVDAVVAINTLKFIWDGEPTQRDLGRSSQAYWELALTPATWRRLLSNRIDVGGIARTLYHRMTARLATTHRTKTTDFRTAVDAYLKRGGKVFALLGTEDASLDGLEAVFGPRGQKLLQAGGTVTIDEYLDHGLALQTSRERALAYVSDFVARL